MKGSRAGQILISCFALVLLSAAGVEEIKAVIRDFGLVGTWSDDCSKEASREHQRYGYETPPNRQPVASGDIGTTRRVGSILEAVLINKTRLRYRFQIE